MLETQSVPLLSREVYRSKVEIHLEAILRSEAFSGSPRCREFLRYVVNETLDGRGSNIKERTVAMDVFGKGVNFDSQAESIVRVKALEVRKRLAQAYQVLTLSDVRIELPTGSYAPVIRCEAPETPPPPEELIPLSPTRKNRFYWILGALVVLSLCMSLVAVGKAESKSSLDLLWQPFVQSKSAVLISLPAPQIYEIRGSAYSKLQNGGSISSLADIQRRENYYVGVGAAEGAARFGEQLGRLNKAFVTKFGDDVTFSDLRRAPAVLLGASSSQWTMELTRNLPIKFEESRFDRITLAGNPNKYWQEDAPNPNGPRHGYALITRLLNSDSGNPLLMVAGIGPYDTQSAVEFLTNAGCFSQFALHAPDWTRRNFQIVIRTKIHRHTPGPPTMVAQHVF
jgi:hypothetical protein